MPEAMISKDDCQGCELCVTACPRKIVVMSKTELNKKGIHPAEISEPDKCTGCAMCAVMCPHIVITVKK